MSRDVKDAIREKKKTKWLHVRLDPRKHKKYRSAARKDGRTLSNWVEHNLDSALA